MCVGLLLDLFECVSSIGTQLVQVRILRAKCPYTTHAMKRFPGSGDLWPTPRSHSGGAQRCAKLLRAKTAAGSAAVGPVLPSTLSTKQPPDETKANPPQLKCTQLDQKVSPRMSLLQQDHSVG